MIAPSFINECLNRRVILIDTVFWDMDCHIVIGIYRNRLTLIENLMPQGIND